MSYGTPLSITLPTIDGVATEAQAATRINDCFTAIKSRLEGKIAPANMDMNADLSFLSGANYFGIKDLQRVTWTSLSAALAAASYPKTCFVLNGDLYYNDDAGNQIRITASGAVNIGGVGGITGSGYGTGGVEVNWDSVNTKYRLRSGANTDDFAALECDDVLLRDGSGHAIRLASPALGADYTFTLPNAVPAANGSVLLMSTAGAITTSRTPTWDSVTLVSGGHFTVAGSGRYKHGSHKLLVSPMEGRSTGSAALASSAEKWTFSAGSQVVMFPLSLIVGKRLLAVTALLKTSSGATKSMRLRKIDSTGTFSIVETVNNTTDLGGSWAFLSFNFADVALSDSNCYWLEFLSGAASDELGGIVIEYDHP